MELHSINEKIKGFSEEDFINFLLESFRKARPDIPLAITKDEINKSYNFTTSVKTYPIEKKCITGKRWDVIGRLFEIMEADFDNQILEKGGTP